MTKRHAKPSTSNPMKTANGELLTALCTHCKCCLAGVGHCWTCHSTISIKDLCDCGSCYQEAIDYNEREAARILERNFRHDLRQRARNM